MPNIIYLCGKPWWYRHISWSLSQNRSLVTTIKRFSSCIVCCIISWKSYSKFRAHLYYLLSFCFLILILLRLECSYDFNSQRKQRVLRDTNSFDRRWHMVKYFILDWFRFRRNSNRFIEIISLLYVFRISNRLRTWCGLFSQRMTWKQKHMSKNLMWFFNIILSRPGKFGSPPNDYSSNKVFIA